MSLRTTLVLMIAFLILGSFAFFDPFHWQQKRDEAKAKESRIFWLKDRKVETLSILHKNGSRIALACVADSGCPLNSSGDWKILEPVKDAADSGAVGAALTALEGLDALERMDVDPNTVLNIYGLDKPELQLEFRLKGEKRAHILKLGNPTPVGSNIYAFVNEQPWKVFIVQNYFLQAVNKDLFQWRDKRLFHEAAEDLKSIAWRGYLFQKKGEAWSMQKPLTAKANEIELGGLASTLAYLSARSIFSENRSSREAAAALRTKPILQINFSGLKAESLTLYQKSGEKKGAYIADASGHDELYLVDGVPFERFQKDILEYRERRLLTPVERSSLDRVSFEFQRDQQSITLVKEERGWVYAQGVQPKETLSQTRISQFLDSLSLVGVNGFPRKTDKAALFSRPADLLLTVSADGGRFSTTFRFVLDGPHAVLTEGETPNEYRKFGDDFLKMLPVRLTDLFETNNQQVVVREADGKRSEPQVP